MKTIFTIKIQSISDIITNSSSEVYRINSGTDWTIFRELWSGILKDWGYSEEEILNDETIGGSIYSKDNNIILDYSILCNVDQDIKEKLEEIFGKENVSDITWEDEKWGLLEY